MKFFGLGHISKSFTILVMAGFLLLASSVHSEDFYEASFQEANPEEPVAYFVDFADDTISEQTPNVVITTSTSKTPDSEIISSNPKTFQSEFVQTKQLETMNQKLLFSKNVSEAQPSNVITSHLGVLPTSRDFFLTHQIESQCRHYTTYTPRASFRLPGNISLETKPGGPNFRFTDQVSFFLSESDGAAPINSCRTAYAREDEPNGREKTWNYEINTSDEENRARSKRFRDLQEVRGFGFDHQGRSFASSCEVHFGFSRDHRDNQFSGTVRAIFQALSLHGSEREKIRRREPSFETRSNVQAVLSIQNQVQKITQS